MRIQVPTNFNYYEEKPLRNDDALFLAFGVKNRRDVKYLKEEVFGATFELSTKKKSLEQIAIFGFKNQRNKLEEEEQLILKLYAKENDLRLREYIIQTGLFAGVVYHKNCQFNITTAYGDVFLRRMLNYVNDIYIDTKEVAAQKSEDANEFQQILAYLFIHSLERVSSMGLPQKYQMRSERSSKVRGKININEYIRRDMPFHGKITTTIKEREYIQEIIDVLYHACKKLERKFSKEIHSKIHGTYQLLKEHVSRIYPSTVIINKAKNHNVLLNPLYAGFKKTLDYAEIILNDLDLESSQKTDKIHTHGYLFDISQLFEVYLEKLLSNNFKDWIVSGQEELIVYDSTFFKRKMYPDLVMRHKYTGQVLVFDAKFKKMRLLKDDLDRSDFYQIHSYIQYYQPEVILGGLIYPLSNEPNKSQTHANSLYGKGTMNVKFVAEGIFVNESMSLSSIIESENSFISRLGNLIEESYVENRRPKLTEV
jgi:5-methylcytosine-specific restriction enzyme subunit McrC